MQQETALHSIIKGGFLRLESVGNAIDQGQTVALNIAGKRTNFNAKPWFWTEQFDQKLQIAGLCDGFTDIIERKVKDKVSFWYYKTRFCWQLTHLMTHIAI